MNGVPVGNQLLSGFASGNTKKTQALPLAKPVPFSSATPHTLTGSQR